MRKHTVCLYILLLLTGYSYAQENYGLTFNSFNVPQEKRTALEIGTDDALCIQANKSFDVSFQFYFIPNRSVYFGYLFRMVNNSKQNIDLLYNEKNKAFNTIAAGGFANLDFSLDNENLFKKWTDIRYHFTKDSLSCFINGTLYKTVQLSLKDKCFEILFGANNSQEFSTTDVPPMVIRNIAIKEDDQLKYLWTLKDNSNSSVIYDSINNKQGSVINPVWSEKLHNNWQLLRSLAVKGDASIAYDKEAESMYVVGDDSVYRLTISDVMVDNAVTASKDYRLFQGNQSIYNSVEKKLYNFYIDSQLIAGYSTNDLRWDKKVDTVGNTEFGHTNRIFVKEENALYVFGGYGQMKYKNRVQRYDFNTRKWADVSVKGDYFIPRYLSAAEKSGNHIYIIGGYGSNSGDQVLNPGYLYDLVDFDLQTHAFKKLYTIKEPDSSFVFAGSMVIDSASQSYYALCFDKSRYDTRLHLMKGSLTSSDYQFLATDIPYSFHDVVSDADLFYSANTKQLIAVTQLVDLGKQTTIKIYSIAFPPMSLIVQQPSASPFTTKKMILTGALLLLMILFIIYLLIKKNKSTVITHPYTQSIIKENNDVIEKPVATEPLAANKVLIDLAERRMFEAPLFVNERANNVNIYLFGSFEITDAEGNELSNQFSPLLRELFLVILLSSFKKGGKGITSEKLNDIFWGDKTGKNAKNNLSVNIVRLKSILSKIGDIHIVKNGEKWECEYDENKVHIDLVDFLNLRSIYPEEHGKEYLSKALYFLSRGAFLKQSEYAWSDDIKADISGKVIDELLGEAKLLDREKDADYLIEVANCIFNFDSLNENALYIKCQTLDKIGRHSIARSTYERFAKEYKKSYGEDFSISFNDILKQNFS